MQHMQHIPGFFCAADIAYVMFAANIFAATILQQIKKIFCSKKNKKSKVFSRPTQNTPKTPKFFYRFLGVNL